MRRVVLTSSFAAMSYGHTSSGRTFTGQDWTDVDGPGVSAYAKSKTLAERAAWDFVDRAAMTDPAARGERFLAVGGTTLWIAGIARVLRDRLGVRVPTREAPDLLVRLASRADPALRGHVHELGEVKRASAEKARRVLGWQPRSNEELIADTAESLLRLGLVGNAA
ncbi:Rossmann-fold NAD(P)-binding domain-containing protein [Amycolatopsis thermoflava]|uniref:hypothetical protein n=1 Tax=Amycolatopsis thermoflava TaxID=84480 RepID=UPI0036613E97